MEINDIITYWKNSQVDLNQGATLSEIAQVEEVVNYLFPESFKVFYTSINGFKDGDTNDALFSIFPLERIVEEYLNEQNDKRFVPFGDFMINSHLIGFSKIDHGIYTDHDLSKGGSFIAPTFEQGMIEIINDSSKIY